MVYDPTIGVGEPILTYNEQTKSFEDSDVDTGNDTINEPSHGYDTGTVGQVSTTNTLPNPLAVDTDYYVISINSDYYQLAMNAAAASGGTEINLINQGNGTHTFPPGEDARQYSITVTSNVTIAGINYLPRSGENSAAGAYKITTTGSPAQDIADTTQSLVRVINATALQSNVNAYYTSSIDDLPGGMLIEEVDLGGSEYAAVAQIFGDEWSPVLPTSGTAVESSSDSDLIVYPINFLPLKSE